MALLINGLAIEPTAYDTIAALMQERDHRTKMMFRDAAAAWCERNADGTQEAFLGALHDFAVYWQTCRVGRCMRRPHLN